MRRAGRQAGDAGRPVRHRREADRRQGPVRAAPARARRAAHADREAAAAAARRPAGDRPRRRFDGVKAFKPADGRADGLPATTACAACCATHGYTRQRGRGGGRARRRSASTTSPTALAAVRAFMQLPEAESLAAANKRIGNILKKSEGAAGRGRRRAAVRAGRAGAGRRPSRGVSRAPQRCSPPATTPATLQRARAAEAAGRRVLRRRDGQRRRRAAARQPPRAAGRSCARR
ncbi:MAG: hypothetical protein MZW92_08580 [Comamonadaceae bacterium]|nr:hypothetical protein [Comamonadaceae bacterium]